MGDLGVYIKINLEKMVWTRNKNTNSYANQIYTIAFEFFDVNVNIAKYYCYSPTSVNKMDMCRGIGANFAKNERPEMSDHYEAAKRTWNGEMDFCTECDESQCAINRYEIQRIGLQ